MKFSKTSFIQANLQRVAVEFRQTPPFHTFFLPKRERKYQRKRFRAAAKTPRGHRSCSALSALEMRRRLQRCNCSSQNEALAPLMGRKVVFLAVAATFCQRRRREQGLGARLLYIHIKKLILSKCQPRHVGLFPFFYFEEIKERLSQGGEGIARENFGV